MNGAGERDGATIDADAPRARPDEEPATTVLRRLLANLAAFAQTYAALAQEDIRATIRGLVIGVVCLGIAAVIGVYAVGLGLATLVIALSAVLPLWGAALAAFLAALGLAAVIALIGLRGVRLRRLGRLAARARTDVQWLRDEITKNV